MLFIIIVVVIIAYALSKNDQKSKTSNSGNTAAMSPDHISVYYAEMLIRIGVGLLREGMASDVVITLSPGGASCSVGSWVLSEAIKGRMRWDDPFLLKAASSTDWDDFKRIGGLRIDEYGDVRCNLNYYAPNTERWYQYVCEYIRNNYPNENRIHIGKDLISISDS